jgi:hypothetical protein
MLFVTQWLDLMTSHDVHQIVVFQETLSNVGTELETNTALGSESTILWLRI